MGVLSLETGEEKIFPQPRVHPRYADTGHLIHLMDGKLWAAPFDLETLKVTGPFIPFPERVWSWQYSISENGTLAYVPDPGGSTLVWVDRNGNVKPTGVKAGNYQSVHFSPDGERLALTVRSDTNTTDIWIYEIARGTLSRLTKKGGAYPVWHPDGSRVAFARDTQSGASHGYGGSLFWIAADGSGEPKQLTTRGAQTSFSWSPDGNALAFAQNHTPTNWDVFVLPLRGEPRPFEATTEFQEKRPIFSRDGRWITFVSTRSGRDEVYVKGYPDEGTELISTEGGRQPLWAHSGRELFYRDGERMMVVSIQTEPKLKAETPRKLSTYSEGGRDLLEMTYDIAPDDQRFIFIQKPTPTHINIVLNWFEKLKRLVPTD